MKTYHSTLEKDMHATLAFSNNNKPIFQFCFFIDFFV